MQNEREKKEQLELTRIAEVKAGELAKRKDVLAIGVTGSLARGNARIGSDIDMTVVLNQADKNYYFERMKIEGRYLEIIYITLDLLKKAIDSGYDGFPSAPWDVYPCNILYDPQGILKDISEKTGKIWISREYYERVIKKKVLKNLEDADKALGRAEKALKQGDYTQAIGTSRGVLEGMFGAIFEATRTPLSPARSASRFKNLMLSLGKKELAKQFFSALDMKDIDKEEAKKRLGNLEHLLYISRNFLLKNPKFKEYIAKHPSRLDFLDSWVNPIFDGEYYLDVANCVSFHAGLLRFLLREISITEWPPQNPKGFADQYLKCKNLDEVDEKKAKRVLKESTLVVAKLKNLINIILTKELEF